MKVLIMLRPDGVFEVITEAECEVIVVCEHMPNDRLYQLTDGHTVSDRLVQEILGDDPIGNINDPKQKALTAHLMQALADGEFDEPDDTPTHRKH